MSPYSSTFLHTANGDFNASIQLAAFFCIVAGHRISFSIPVQYQSIGSYTEILAQISGSMLNPFAGQSQIVFFRSDTVRETRHDRIGVRDLCTQPAQQSNQLLLIAPSLFLYLNRTASAFPVPPWRDCRELQSSEYKFDVNGLKSLSQSPAEIWSLSPQLSPHSVSLRPGSGRRRSPGNPLTRIAL